MAKRKRRTFTPAFKAEVVLEALRGGSSQAELCRRHNLSDDPLSKWKQQAVEHLVHCVDLNGGWRVSQHLTQPLTFRPLEQALRQSVPEIHHSDQGVQYLSNIYLSTLAEHGVEISVARRGCPWENGYAERLLRTLKAEEVYLNDYQDIHEARTRIEQFIEQVYHQKRPHSALGYLTPVEFEQQNLGAV